MQKKEGFRCVDAQLRSVDTSKVQDTGRKQNDLTVSMLLLLLLLLL